jgi:DNA-binding CsgD family transcriptional regulator/PAS domain-containing protein
MRAAGQDVRVEQVVSLLYDAALDPGLWSGVAGKIASAFNSTSAVLKTYGAGDQISLVEVTDNLVVAPTDQAWADYWHHNDLWVDRSVNLGLGRIAASHELVREREFERSAFYQEWTRHLEIYHMIGAVFCVDPLTMGVLGIHRPKRGGAYGEKDRRRVADFLPHLNRALRLRQRLEQVSLAQSACLEALERLDTAVVVLDAECRILHTNGLAARVLKQSGDIEVRAGRVRFADPELDNQLLRHVQKAIRTAAGDCQHPESAFAVRRDGRLPITVLVTPLRPTWNGQKPSGPAALVFVRDPERGALAHDLLRELFGLTPTEAAIAALLARGCALDEIAEQSSVGIGTVRSHLKAILSKTGTHRQAQLVALLSSSVASIGLPS